MASAVVVLAGGSGSRVGAPVNKVYLPLAGRHVLSWSLLAAAQVPGVAEVVLVVRPEDVDLARQVVARDAPHAAVRTVVGGATRHASEDAAFAHLAPRVEADEIDLVAVHDGARPLAGVELFGAVLATAARDGGAVPVLPATGLLELQDASAGFAMDAGRLARVQTPQAYRARDLFAAYAAAGLAGFDGTDTAGTVEAFGDLVVRAVPGSPHNIKITYGHDLVLAAHLLAARHTDGG